MDQPTEKLIEDYLFNRLPKEKVKEVEARVSTDESFAHTLSYRQLEHDAMAIANQDELRASMNSWSLGAGKEEQAAPLRVVHRRKPITRILGLAAGFLLLIFAGSSFFATTNYSDGSLAERYSRSRVAGARGTGDATILEPIKALMATEKYQEAVTALNGIDGNAAAMLRGEAYLELTQYDESLLEYDKVATSDSQLADEAGFQKAIVLLAAGRVEEATLALQEVAGNPGHTFSRNAATVLQDMKRFWRKLSW